MFVPKNLNFCVSSAKKEAGIFCCALRCHNKPNSRKRGLCHKHYATHRRIVDPVYDRYFNFKNNALSRPLTNIIGPKFTITLEQFRNFCNETGYIIKRGYRGKNCTVDRKKNKYGYHIWNIQLITNMANIRKYHDHDKHQPITEDDECPF